MKKFTSLLIALCLAIPAMAQYTFNWTPQTINPDNNMQEMNIVNDTTTILVGYGQTFVVSDDLGSSWNKVPILTPLYDFEDVSINASGLGYACSGDQRVYDNPTTSPFPDVYADGAFLVTTDFGATWTTVDISTIGTGDDPALNPSHKNCYGRHFRAVEVLDNNNVFVGIEWYAHDFETGSRVTYAATFVTTDQETWTAITSDAKYPYGIESDGTNVYFGGSNHLYKSDVNGTTVTDLFPALTTANGGDASIFTNDITIVSVDEIYVITSIDGIFLSTDQGTTFTELGNSAPVGANDMIVVNDTVYFVLGSSARSKYTLDGGDTWTACYPGTSCYEIGGIMNDTIFSLAKSDIYKLAVADLLAGNINWVTQNISNGENLQKMEILDANNAVIFGYGETAAITSDAGVSWTPIDLPYLYVSGALYNWASVSTRGTTSYASAARYAVINIPNSSVYTHGLIYKSQDYWKTWEAIDLYGIGTGDDPAYNPNADGCYGISPTQIECLNDTTLLVYINWGDSTNVDKTVYHSNVFKSTDSGKTWKTLLDDLGSTYINDFYFLDDQTGYLMGKEKFLKTTDAGESFINMYKPIYETSAPADTSLYLKTMVYLDESEWFLVTSVDGIFNTKDGGVNYEMYPGIGGGNGLFYLNDSTYLVVGATGKNKITWNYGQTWYDCYPGSSVWGIGGVLNDSLVTLAKSVIYKIDLESLLAPSQEADILEFHLNEQTGDATIDSENHTVAIEVVHGTDVTTLTPTLRISEGASVTPGSEVEQDFSTPVTYTVKAEDYTISVDWVVTVSIAENLTETALGAIQMYPNPASDRLFINNLENVANITVYTIQGIEVLNTNAFTSRLELNVSNLAKGVYFVTFLDVEGNVATQKFVKK